MKMAALGARGTPPSLEDRPRMTELYYFTGRSGKRYRILDQVAPWWEDLAFALEFEGYQTETVKKSNMGSVEDCCRVMIGQWLQGRTSRHVTWDTLFNAMEDVPSLHVLLAQLREDF